MKAIVFNTSTTTLDMNHDSYPLKAMYLLCDHILVAGEIGGNLLFEKNYKQFDIKKRILIMEIANRWTDNHEGQIYLDSVKVAIKEYARVKHKSREILIASKTMENVFNAYFDLFVADRLGRIKKSGLYEMSKLLDNDIIMTSLYEFSIGETILEKDTAETKARKIINLVFPEGTKEPTIMVLPDQFARNDYTENENGVRKNEVEEVKEDWIRLDHCFSIPPIEGFTAMELKVLRAQLSNSGSLFRKRMDDWILLFKTSMNAVERKNFLSTNVLTVADELQLALVNTDMLRQNSLKLPLDSLELQIFIGETPLDLLWNYYAETKMIDADTEVALNKIAENNPLYPKNIPIISISPTYLNMDKMENLGFTTLETDTDCPLKRNLSID